MKEKPIRFNFKVPSEETETLNFLETQFKLHKGSKTKAFLQIFKDNIAIKKTILQKDKEIKACMQYLEEHANGETNNSTEISEKPCSFMVYVEQEKVCGDTNAPIDTFLKRHLNPQICALCQKLKREKFNALQKKADEKQEKALEKAKAETHKHAQRLFGKEEFAGQPRVNYDTSNPNGAPIWIGE